jgi:hypothetical protein
MVVINWIKDAFGQGSKRFLYSIGRGASSVSSKIKNSLVSEQRALAEHYYNSHLNFTAKLEDLTDKIKEFDNSNSAGVSYIEKKQQELLFACLRMETALKTTAELKRERKEWERRLPSDSPVDILHPLARLELINSELRIREQDFSHLSPARTESAPAETIQVLAISQEESALKPSKTRSVAIGRESIYTDDNEDLPSEYLIKQAASIITELSTSQQTTSNNQEYLQKIAELRDLHATLKRSSRAQSHFRYRNALRNRLAKIFY